VDRLGVELEALRIANDAGEIEEVKRAIALAYAALVKNAPRIFAVDDERGRREPIIVRALLKQAEGVHQLELDRLYAAGLTSLEAYFHATPEDIAQTAGVALDVAREVVERFRGYRRELTSDAFAKEQRALKALVEQLKKEQAAYERASSGWSDGASEAKKRARRDRAETVLRIEVLLARLGELERVGWLERASFEQKIRGLEAFLEESKRTAGVTLP
ncbi:MAG TPA: hypothetical protein VHB21_15095, partial [Minicystis sp.]|nr:hypothetical protein [Minicystis sp.]